ncbi:MAG TPA: alpha/beta hydrolase [Candidatus Binataceae bacterium]|nr:alpha/beta hydrolase [Candidatus Binataceae bacterium]
MRRDIEIIAEGAVLRGWLYMPERAATEVPAVVMAHGFSAVKEMYLDRYAEVFSAAGLAALVFDNRNFGASGGEPRYEIDPWQQVRDYRHAITWIRRQPGIAPERIGVWGSSYSGGHVLVVGAIDRRVKCVVAQVPLVSGSRNLARLVRADMAAPLRAQFDADREARFAGGAPAMVPVVTADPNGAAALPTADSWQWFTETGRTRAPAWRNEVTLRTVEMLGEYEPDTYIARISPTPLLMLIAANDHLTVADEAFGAYNRALEPKSLVVLNGGHFDAYVKGFEHSSIAARDWFLAHLAAQHGHKG